MAQGTHKAMKDAVLVPAHTLTFPPVFSVCEVGTWQRVEVNSRYPRRLGVDPEAHATKKYVQGKANREGTTKHSSPNQIPIANRAVRDALLAAELALVRRNLPRGKIVLGFRAKRSPTAWWEAGDRKENGEKATKSSSPKCPKKQKAHTQNTHQKTKTQISADQINNKKKTKCIMAALLLLPRHLPPPAFSLKTA
ncbi:hypothetical protein TcCL_Unassigned01533 [Trypanosoma cruzi]|nr:hypothetical protein TcCL_Unassigned01533 [Trypanosoma cruzi]